MSSTQRRTKHGLLVAAVCVGSCCLLPALARSSEPGSDEFVPLFDQKDMSGWETTGNWGFESDGVLALRPKRQGFRLFPDYKSFLWSKATYDNFVLDFEYKLAEDANSGVFVRSTSQRSYIQAQLCDSHGKDGPLDDRDCGAVVDVAAPSKNMSKPAGQWNRMIITCNDDRMRVELNGEEVVDLDLTESQKTRSIRDGRIGFENKNSPVAFRNAKIKELKPEKR